MKHAEFEPTFIYIATSDIYIYGTHISETYSSLINLGAASSGGQRDFVIMSNTDAR